MSHGRFAPRAHFVPQMHMQVRYACICDVDDVCRTDMLGVKSDRDGEKVEDEEEIAAKAHLQQLLPTLLSEWEQVDRDLQALMMKYGLQPKFGRSQVMVKVE